MEVPIIIETSPLIRNAMDWFLMIVTSVVKELKVNVKVGDWERMGFNILTGLNPLKVNCKVMAMLCCLYCWFSTCLGNNNYFPKQLLVFTSTSDVFLDLWKKVLSLWALKLHGFYIETQSKSEIYNLDF